MTHDNFKPANLPVSNRKRSQLRSAAGAAYQAWYKTAAWLAIRTRRLRQEPLCRICEARGVITAATVCDHVTAHKGNRELFFSFENTQSLCKPCHDSVKQAEERRGHVIGTDAKGRPIDPDHPWNRHD